MRGPIPKLHLPMNQWPEEDRRLWKAATSSYDPFDDAGGARLADATLASRWYGWRRFLGFLSIEDPAALELKAIERLSIERVRGFAEGRIRLLTTNFDTLFERAWFDAHGAALPSHAGIAMPQPNSAGCSGVLHLHGRLSDPRRALGADETDLVLTPRRWMMAFTSKVVP
jgi:hypothetical protein